MTLTKDSLVELLKDKTGYQIKQAKDIVELVLEEMKSSLELGNQVKITGFGKWTCREKKSRPGRNPHTGQTIEITSRKVVTFHPSDKLRLQVNKGE